MKKITCRNVSVRLIDGILYIKKIEPITASNFNTINNCSYIIISKIDKDCHSIDTMKIIYKFIPIISFNWNKFSPSEVKEFLGIKFVLRGYRQLIYQSSEFFVHNGKIVIGEKLTY